MNDYRWKMLWDAQRADLAREAEAARLGADLPRRPAPWRALLITAVLLIGAVAWWIH